MTRDADPAVIEAMLDERRRHHGFILNLNKGWPNLGKVICTGPGCNLVLAEGVTDRVAAYAISQRHIEERVLAAALAVTACTTCGGLPYVEQRAVRHGDDDWEQIEVEMPCPVCHGSPPRRLVMMDELEQVGCLDADGSFHYKSGWPGDRLVFVFTERNEGESSASPMWTDTDRCQAMRDGDCNWPECPQNRDGEPMRSGRHCPLDTCTDED